MALLSLKVYEGLVYMDFSKKLMEEQSYGTEFTTVFVNAQWAMETRFTKLFVCPFLGNYVSMDMNELPSFWLAYLSDPSDSGRIHSNIRQRWLSGTYLILGKGNDDLGLFRHAAITLVQIESASQVLDR